MSVKLVLLGMLKYGPQYGYELKSRIENEMGDWTSIAFGSVYFALKKLSEEGFVRQIGEEQHGNRPSRIVYEITADGKREFSRLLHKNWTDRERTFYSFDIGLYFMHELDSRTSRKLIREKILFTEQSLSFLREHRAAEMENPHVPPLADAIFTHSLRHLEAELEWLKEVEKKFTADEY